MNTENPSLEAQRVRRKEERKKKILKAFLSLIVVTLVFSIGFCSGVIFKSDSSVKDVFKDLSLSKETPEPNAEAQTEEKIINQSEEIKLEALKNDFADYVKEKYPQADLSFAVKNLETGAFVLYNNKKMNSASIIKLFILETVYDEIEKGSYVLNEEKEKELGLMITESKNTAANLFIDDFGGVDQTRKVTEENLINKNIKKRGYKHTEINRKMHDKTPPEGPSGYQNYTSAEDVLVFLEGIYNKSHFKEPFNTYALNLLKNQTRRSKIPAKIASKYPGIVVANKTGELSQVENDAALIMCDDFKLAFVVLIDNIPFKADGSTDYDLKNKVQETISELGLKLVEFYKNNKF